MSVEHQALRVAIVGLGRIASLLEDDPKREKPCTHAGAIVDNIDCRLVAGCDIDLDRRDQFARRWAVPVYADLKTMLSSERPDILHIATHAPQHRSQIAQAIQAGIRVIVCEKPLAANRRDARVMAIWHRQGRAVILCNHERRYARDYQQARALIQAGNLGLLQSVQACLAMGTHQPLGDVLWHDGTHLVDCLNFLTGGVLRHHRTAGLLDRAGGEAWLHGEIVRPGQSSLPTVLEVAGNRDHLIFEVLLNFSAGRIRIGNGLFEIYESAESPYARGFRSLVPLTRGFGQPSNYFRGMVADAVACARHPGQAPLSSAEDALAVTKYLSSVHPWRLKT